jgi:hypothetical protein
MIIDNFDRLKDALQLLKKTFLLPNDKIDIDSIRKLVDVSWNSFDTAFKKNDLSNANKNEDEKFYLNFIHERREAGHSLLMFVKCKDHDLIVGMIEPEEIAVCIDRLMKQPEIMKAVMSMKLKDLDLAVSGSQVIEMPSDSKSEDMFDALKSIMTETDGIDPSSSDGPEHISSIIKRTLNDLKSKRPVGSDELITIRSTEDIKKEEKDA